METIVLSGSEQIMMARLITLKSALKLEIWGMKRRGPSAYSIIKRELGFKGNKESVFNQLTAYIEELKKQ
jgi:hypothetical protein